MAVTDVPWITTADKVVGQGHPTLPDVANKVMRFVLEKCGMAPSANGFIGFEPKVNVKAYGAVGDGVTNDYAAIMAAFDVALALGHRLWFPPGRYKYDTNMRWTVGDDIVTTPTSMAVAGVAGKSWLVPSAAVTVALALTTGSNTDGRTNGLKVTGMSIEGDATNGATGWLVGDNASNVETSGGIVLEDCRAMRFKGTGGKGIHVQNVVSCRYIRCYFGRNATNVYVKGKDPTNSLPTVQAFVDCDSREAGYVPGGYSGGAMNGRGIELVNGYRVTWDGGVIEANRGEGTHCAPTSGSYNVLYCHIDGAWYEANQYGGSSMAYDIYLDGRTAGTVMFALRNLRFSGGHRAIMAQSVVNFVLRNCLPANAANQVVIDPFAANSTVGVYGEWPNNNAPFATVCTNNSTNFRGNDDYLVVKKLTTTDKLIAQNAQVLGTLVMGDAVIGAPDVSVQPGAGGTGALRGSTNGNVVHWTNTTFDFDVTPNSGAYKAGGVQVVGTRAAAVADATNAAAAPTQAEFNALVTTVNSLLNRLRNGTGHGLIA